MPSVSDLTKDMSKLKLSFDRKAWTRKHLKKKSKCPRCGTVLCTHIIKRHQKTAKCKMITAIRREASTSS